MILVFFAEGKSAAKGVTNLEAQVIFALKLLKSEKDVTIMAFTDDRHKLKPILWTAAETTFEKAMEFCQNEIVSAPIFSCARNPSFWCLAETEAKNERKHFTVFD